MSRDNNAEPTAYIPKWILAGSAVLGALFAYFALVVSFALIAILYQLGLIENYGRIVIFLVIAIITGGGLRWIARRYRSPRVQAGALVGAGIMTALLLVAVLLDSSVRLGPFVLMTLAGLGGLITVVPLTATPSPRPDERTGIDILWGSLLGGRWRPVKDESSNSTQTGESTPGTAGPSAENPSGLSRRLPVSRYWLVVGSAFVISLPIALANPELGIGLLSAFLTAYALSHQIEPESKHVSDEE